MASGGITAEPVQTARLGSYMTSTGGGTRGPAGMTTTERKRQEPVVKANTADRQLNNLVIKSRNDERYRNEQGAGNNYPSAYESAPESAKKFVDRQIKKFGRLNEAAKARLNPYLSDRTQYQLDLDKFRKASPENEAAYVRRFPKTAAFERILRKGAEGIVGTPARIIKNITDNYLDGVKNMVEKISGVEAKNIDIAKNKDTDINTIVNNLQRNIKEEREDGKARGMTEADLTAMYGEPIDIETGDDIFGGNLLGMEMLEDDSPLNVAPTEGIAQSEAEQKKLEGDFTPPGDETVADQPQFTPIRLDRTVGDEGLFDLTGSDREGEVSAFDLDPDETYFDLNRGIVLDPIDQKIARGDAARKLFAPGFDESSSTEDFSKMIDDEIAARQKGFPDIDVTQEQRDFVNNPIEGQATAAGQGLVYSDGTPIMEQGPTPLFESEMLDDETIRKAIEGKADGGQIFGNQNMSTFDKLKAIADGIADNK